MRLADDARRWDIRENSPRLARACSRRISPRCDPPLDKGGFTSNLTQLDAEGRRLLGERSSRGRGGRASGERLSAGKERMSKGWGAALRGHDFDLQDWREMLEPPFDPWVEVHGDDVVLRSASLDDLTSASEVRDRVVAHIERLNGVMFVVRRSQPLQFSGAVELAPNGEVHRTGFAEGHLLEARDRLYAGTVVVTGPGGKPQPPPPAKPSE